jgi:hypothetical protein
MVFLDDKSFFLKEVLNKEEENPSKKIQKG